MTMTALAVLALLLLAPTAAAEWPMDGGNSAHTGEQLTPPIGPSVQWEVQVNGELMCPPSTAYSKLYIGTSDGYLKVLDERDGGLLWEVKLGSGICATPLIDSQTAFVPVGHTLHAVALTNKSDKWTYEAVGELRGSPVLADDLVFIGSEDKRVYAIDKYDGHLEWSLKLDDVVATSPSVSGLTLVVGTEAGTLYGIHRTEGEELWRAELGSAVSTAASVSSNTAMVGTYGGRLYGIDLEDGEVLWTFPHTAEPALDPILTTPVTNSGLVYFGSDGLYCLEVRNGLKVWHHPTGDTVRGTPAIVESYLVFGCYDGLVRCMDKNTGRVVWRFSAETIFRSSVSIDYGKAFIGGRDGRLYARSILNSAAPVIIGPFNLDAEAQDSILFEVSASDPEGNMLTYLWDFGDGNTSTEMSPLHEYTLPGAYTVEVTVSDGTKSKKHTISIDVHPFESSSVGGDEGGMSMALVGGAAAAVAIVVVLVLVLVVMPRVRGRRGDRVEDGEAREEPPESPVEVYDALEEPAYRPIDDGYGSVQGSDESYGWQEEGPR